MVSDTWGKWETDEPVLKGPFKLHKQMTLSQEFLAWRIGEVKEDGNEKGSHMCGMEHRHAFLLPLHYKGCCHKKWLCLKWPASLIVALPKGSPNASLAGTEQSRHSHSVQF